MERNEQVLTRDEVIVQFRDRYEPAVRPPVDLDETVSTMLPDFVQEMVAREIMEARNRYNSGNAFPPATERKASYEIAQSYEVAGNEKDPSKLTFIDKTGLRNEDFLKQSTEEIIRKELINEKRHTYNHIAMFAIDLNGLKALNDYYGRPAGDAYLQRIANWLNQSETLAQLREKHIAITVARLGAGAADEFMILAKGNPDNDVDWEKLWSEVSIALQEEMARLDVQDIWPAEEIEKAIEKHKLRERIPDLPRDLKFEATAGFGRTTLEHILSAVEDVDPRNRITSNDQPTAMLQKLTGSMISVSLKYMKAEKNMTKESPLSPQEYGLGAIVKSTGR